MERLSCISPTGEYKLLPYDLEADPQWCEWFQSEPGGKMHRRYCRASYDHVEKFILSNPEQDWHRNNGPSATSFCPSLFEIMCRDKPTKPYLDLDWAYEIIPDLTDNRVVQLVDMIKNAAHSLLRAALAKTTNTHKDVTIEPCLLASKRPKKFSIHAVWNIVNCNTGEQWALANGACAKQWAVNLRSELVARHGVEMNELIDIQPYAINVGKTYNFRVAGATKGIEPRSRLDLYDDGGLVPLRQLAVEDRLAYWRQSLVQYFINEPKPLIYDEHKSTGNRNLDTTGSRVVSQAGSIRGVGDVKLHASIIRAPFELEACACLQEYIRWYSQCVEKPHLQRLDPFTHKSTDVYRVDINVWQGYCNWCSQSGLCHTKLQRYHDGSPLHRSNNVHYSLTYHRPQLMQRCQNTACREWREARPHARQHTFLKLPEVPDDRGLLQKAQRLMASAGVRVPAEPEAVPASPLLSPGTQAITELTCDAIQRGPDGHYTACTLAEKGDPFQGGSELMQEIARLAPRTATHCCVFSHMRIPLPKKRSTGVGFKCMSMVLWGDLLKRAWLKGSQVCELTAPARTWFLCWNTATSPQMQSGVKVEPGLVHLLAQPCIQHPVPCSVTTPYWFSTIPTQDHTRPSSAMVRAMYTFPFEHSNTARIYRNAKELLPQVQQRPAKMLDVVRIGALLISVLYAPADCVALQVMAQCSSGAVPEFDEEAQARVENHMRDKDARCLRVGRAWATSVWVDGPGATSDHLKALFCMLHGLLATSFL